MFDQISIAFNLTGLLFVFMSMQVRYWVYALGTLVGMIPGLAMDVYLGSLMADFAEVTLLLEPIARLID